MPNSVHERHSSSEFYYPGETNYRQMLRFKAKITPNKTATKTAKKKCFLVFSTKSEKIAIQQSHIINPLLTSFARSVQESLPSVFIAQTSFVARSVRKPQAIFPVQTSHSVNKSLVLCILLYSDVMCRSLKTSLPIFCPGIVTDLVLS